MEGIPKMDLDRTGELVRGVAKALQEGKGAALMVLKDGELEATVFITTDESFSADLNAFVQYLDRGDDDGA